MANAIERTKQALTQTKPKTPGDAIVSYLARPDIKEQFNKALPMHLLNNADRYVRSFMTQIRQVPALQKCDMQSLMGAMLTGTALGLDPSPSLGQFYILPYGDKAQFQLGYQGMIDLALRAKVKKVWAHKVCANDVFEIKYGLHEDLIHEPCLDASKGRGEAVGYYAAAILPNGESSFVYMTKGEVLAHAKRFSKTFGRGPWTTDFDEMAKKTVTKKLFKWLPKSTELAHAITKDETIVNATATNDDDNIFDMPQESCDNEPEKYKDEDTIDQALEREAEKTKKQQKEFAKETEEKQGELADLADAFNLEA